MAARDDDPAVLAGILDRSPYSVALIAEDGTIRWASTEGTRRIFGYEVDDIIGTNILDHIDLSWDAAALASIGDAVAAEGLRLPTYFRAFRKDGSTTIVEAWANAAVRDPVLRGLVAFIRRWDERMLLDAALEAVGRGDDISEVARLLLESMACETLEADGSILWSARRRAFAAGVRAPGVPAALAGVDDDDGSTPWARAQATGDRVIVPVAELPAPIASAAQAAGYAWCWAWPVFDVRTDDVGGCVVAWRREDLGNPDHSRVEAMGRIVRITELAIERRATLESLHRAATIDPLTDLANRARFYDALGQALAGDAGPVAVLFLDLDGFKPVNDEWGHACGDDVLRQVAARLAGAVRPGDLVARLGGDEFGVLCPASGDIDDLERVAARLAGVVVEPIGTAGPTVSLGVSIGGVIVEDGGRSPDEVVAAADQAMYSVKAGGKGGWRIVLLAGSADPST